MAKEYTIVGISFAMIARLFVSLVFEPTAKSEEPGLALPASDRSETKEVVAVEPLDWSAKSLLQHI